MARVVHSVRIYLVTVISFVLYGYELVISNRLHGPTLSLDDLGVLCTLLLALYGVALIRAWELIGARRSGLSGWLNPLRDLPLPEPVKTTEQAQERWPMSGNR